MAYFVSWAVGTVLGSIPFGLLLARVAGLGDVRTIGSGSIGATNVLRTGRKDIAAATLALDAAKGAVAVLVVQHYVGVQFGAVAGLFAVVGHCFSPWVGGRGGKGIATGLGVLLAIAWPVGLLCAALWLLTALITKRSSAGSLLACAAAVPLVAMLAGSQPAIIAGLIAVLVFYRHEANIRRLLAGTEPKIGAK